MNHMLPTIALGLAVISAVLAAAVPIYFGGRKPGYSHLSHTISELGEIGSPVGESVSYFGFIGIGISLWLFLIVATKLVPYQSEVFFMFSLVGAGYVGGGLFRCDPEAPFIGSWRNTLHNIFGAMEYVGAAAAFFTLKHSVFWWPLSAVMSHAGAIVLLCFAGLGFSHPFRGLIQRVAEATIFSGIVVVGWWVYRESA